MGWDVAPWQQQCPRPRLLLQNLHLMNSNCPLLSLEAFWGQRCELNSPVP